MGLKFVSYDKSITYAACLSNLQHHVSLHASNHVKKNTYLLDPGCSSAEKEHNGSFAVSINDILELEEKRMESGESDSKGRKSVTVKIRNSYKIYKKRGKRYAYC